MRRRRGTTLVELIVSSVLFLVLLTVGGACLYQGMSAWARAMDRCDQENALLSVVARLRAGLEGSDADSLTLFGEDHARQLDDAPSHAAGWLAAPSSGILDSLGSRLWDRHEIWYLAADALSHETGLALWRQQKFLPQPDSHPSEYRLASFAPQSGDAVVLRNVSAFVVSAPLRTSVNPAAQSTRRTNPASFTLEVRSTLRHTAARALTVHMSQNDPLEPGL